MIYLHKILPLIASPLFICSVLVMVGAAFKSRRLIFFGVTALLLCSLPLFSNRLVYLLEKDYRLLDISTVQEADAIVVLSGMVRTLDGQSGLTYEWTEAADRIFAGIKLKQANKAPYLVLTGGKLPWSLGQPEGEFLREIAVLNGVSEKQILITENVENTDQEAKAAIKLLDNKEPNIILVTSAFHMPRAKKVFEAAGLKVMPFAVDFRVGKDKLTPIDFIPSADALRDTSFFVRELIGRAYYLIKY